MSLSKASILELEHLSLHDFEDGQKFIRMAKRLQTPERVHLIAFWKKRVEALT